MSSAIDDLKKQLRDTWVLSPPINRQLISRSSTSPSLASPLPPSPTAAERRSKSPSYYGITFNGSPSHLSPSSPDVNINRTTADTIHLATNLSTQVDYNSTLLKQIEFLENDKALAQRIIHGKDDEVESLKNYVQQLTEKNKDLQRRFESNERMYEKLTLQHQALVQVNHKLESDHLVIVSDNESFQHRLRIIGDEKNLLLKKIKELEMTIQWMKSTQTESNEEGLTLSNRLKLQLDKTIQELNQLKDRYQTLDLQNSRSTDEIVKLQRKIDRLLSDCQNESFVREEIAKQNRQLKNELADLTTKYHDNRVVLEDTKAEFDDLSSKYNTLQGRHDEVQSQLTETDAKWRNVEEILAHRNRECQSLKKENQRLNDSVAHAERHAQSMEIRTKDFERMIEESKDKSISLADDRIKELTNMLSQSALRLQDERLLHDGNMKKLSQEIEETHGLLATVRNDCDKRVNEILHEKQALENEVSRLEAKVQRMQEEKLGMKRIFGDDEQRMRNELTNLKQEMVTRGEIYVNSLTNLQSVVNKLREDFYKICEENAHINSQYMKLVSVLHSLTGGNFNKSNGNDGGGQGSGDGSSSNAYSGHSGSNAAIDEKTAIDCPILRPFALYGAQIREVIQQFTSKLQQANRATHELQEELNLKSKELSDFKVQEDQHILTIENYKHQVMTLQKTIMVLESQFADVHAAHKAVSSELQCERSDTASRIQSLENRIAEIVAQNNSLQGDIMKMEGDGNNMRKVFEKNLHDQCEKTKNAERKISQLELQLQESQDRFAKLQDDLARSEETSVSIQGEFQGLRASAQKLVDMAYDERNKYAQQISALKDTISKYQGQLTQQQQLLEVVQAHRQDLLDEIEKQKSTIRLLNESLAGTLPIPPTLKFSQHQISSGSSHSSSSSNANNHTGKNTHLYSQHSNQHHQPPLPPPRRNLSDTSLRASMLSNVDEVYEKRQGLRIETHDDMSTSSIGNSDYDYGAASAESNSGRPTISVPSRPAPTVGDQFEQHHVYRRDIPRGPISTAVSTTSMSSITRTKLPELASLISREAANGAHHSNGNDTFSRGINIGPIDLDSIEDSSLIVGISNSEIRHLASSINR